MRENWQPIVKAPFDGTVIKARDHAGNVSMAAFRQGRWRITFPINSLMRGALMDGQPFNAIEFDDAVVLQGWAFYVASCPSGIIQSAAFNDPSSWATSPAS